MKKIIFLSLIISLSFTQVGFAGESYCEVVNTSGNSILRRDGIEIPVNTADILIEGDVLIVPDGATVDLAFDKAWENVSRIDESSVVVIKSLNPTKLKLTNGDIFSRLDNLPRGSSFEIATPVAIAAVRGTKYRTTHEGGVTTILNESETSEVYVYLLDENGNPTGDPIVLQPGETTEVESDFQVFDELLPDTGVPDDDTQDRQNEDGLNDELNEPEPVVQQEREEHEVIVVED